MARDSIEKQPSDEQEALAEALPVTTPEQKATEEAAPEQSLPVPEEEPGNNRKEIAKSASLVAMGNLFSSLMGVGRQVTVGATGMPGTFLAALKPTQTFYDLLINGSVSGALIPTFNDYATPEKHNELRRLVYTLVNLVFLIALAASLFFLFISPWFIKSFLVSGFDEPGKQQVLLFSQIIFFSLLIMAPFSVLQAALYTRRAFGWAAIATSAYHIGIIIGAIAAVMIGKDTLGAQLALAFGVILGALGEILFLLPAIIRQRLGYMFVLDLKHPALRTILRLYGPISISLLISMGIVFVDLALQSNTPCVATIMGNTPLDDCRKANVAALGLSTTLIQFPIGLVAMALQMAVLPMLSSYARDANGDKFKETLLLGLRLGLLLMIPAMAGLITLQTPITRFIFEHGDNTASNVALIALALQYYALQLPFVAIDQLLIAAFYSRKDTLTPMILNFVCIGGYLLVALAFYQTWGMPAMAFANTVQNSLHGIILLLLLRRAMGSLHLGRMLPALLKILAGTAALVVVALAVQFVLKNIPIFSLEHLLGRILTLVIAGGCATVAYFGVVMLLRVEELHLLKTAVLAKLGKK